MREDGKAEAKMSNRAMVLAAVLLLGYVAGFVFGAASVQVKADEPLVYSAPICCFVRIPNCYCDKPESQPWPDPPCPTVWNGAPMVEYPAGETWPAFCAVTE